MKRTIASLVSAAALLSFAAPAFAYAGTRNNQARMSLRGVEAAALAAYTNRHSRAYVRSRYNSLLTQMAPGLLLTVTGRSHMRTDLMKIARPSPKQIQKWTGKKSHCARRCDE